MGFEDRDYYREPRSGGGLAGVGNWLLYGRVHLFRAFRIDVAAHSSLIITMVLMLLFAGTGFVWQDRVISAALLFIIVLMHEFGHCFGARWVGGDAEQIVMHPLGGLAFTQPPSNWKAHLVTTVCGPAVNFALCIISGGLLYALVGQIPWKPYFYGPWTSFRGWLDPIWLLYWLYQTNWALLLFNLLPIYPLDGGRIVQESLWPKYGYYRSMVLATNTGIIGSVAFGMVAIATGAIGLLILAFLGLYACIQMRNQLREMGPHGFSEYDDPFAVEMQRAQQENRVLNRGPSRAKIRAAAKAAQRAASERQQLLDEQAEIDRILAKVSAHGMHSLSRAEQKSLKRATQKQQERDAARR